VRLILKTLKGNLIILSLENKCTCPPENLDRIMEGIDLTTTINGDLDSCFFLKAILGISSWRRISQISRKFFPGAEFIVVPGAGPLDSFR
jgi:hypothetical protein